ncbi:hypothetical protein KSP35_22985 [Aquihabitans sp. G128]|uniref:hypothetical protein n=1 Tax=Aquihabitans sp. G128 TaxID=2849779 RepID=UPI001C23A398|nr:hypothetical protein [Aquihabitans sp. G128]QXC61140.1 hypothetical protein KSP35_22985 [Aquihabitans sp. G128]
MPSRRPSSARDEAQARRRRILASVDVPSRSDAFWPDLGRRLLAERERPAAPTIDPAARLARVHPSEGRLPTRPPSTPVETLADRAEQQRPRRRWGKPLALAAAVLVVLGLVAAAVTIGLSGRTPDGSVSDAELADTMATALSASRFLRVDVRVDEVGTDGSRSRTENRLTIADDGSWSTGRTDAIEQASYAAGFGLSRHVAALAGRDGAPATVLGSGQEGLSAGGPDPSADAPGFLADLQSAGTILRSRASARAGATRRGAMRTWTARRSLGTGPDGATEAWEIEVRRSDGLPVRIERHRGGALVRRIRFSGWTPASDLPDDTFVPALPAGAQVERFGFLATDLPAVVVLGRGQAVTPAALPEGFELSSVFVRGEPAAGARSTGGGANPPDRAVQSIAYQRGPERITVTTREAGDDPKAWQDPFAAAGATSPGTTTRTLGDGRFNQARVQVSADPRGRARLWGVADGVVFTVAGDLTVAEALRVASSLR